MDRERYEEVSREYVQLFNAAGEELEFIDGKFIPKKPFHLTDDMCGRYDDVATII